MQITAGEKDIRFLIDHCVRALSEYNHYKVLFEGRGRNGVSYGDISPITIGDLRAALRDHVILQVCKLADPAKDHRGNENLSLKWFVSYADFQGEADRLREIEEELQEFLQKLKPARDKILTHSDRRTFHSEEILGGATDAEWDQFWRDLDSFVAVLGQRYMDRNIHIRSAGITDAAKLRDVLQAAAAQV